MSLRRRAQRKRLAGPQYHRKSRHGRVAGSPGRVAFALGPVALSFPKKGWNFSHPVSSGSQTLWAAGTPVPGEIRPGVYHNSWEQAPEKQELLLSTTNPLRSYEQAEEWE
ncbi:hypothetical protein CSOJ01_01708 [Colletotrichum sojae]|uniref:Uncharacterized protein n=1 Tax=Colletotrichum sojae TaxID=2175907 RepID=A0A8H6JT87_9PEZI|nr:hypothetical protein CSOJ01_01708 [Colletotrichum sojae]